LHVVAHKENQFSIWTIFVELAMKMPISLISFIAIITIASEQLNCFFHPSYINKHDAKTIIAGRKGYLTHSAGW
jgi:hypothetical protein